MRKNGRAEGLVSIITGHSGNPLTRKSFKHFQKAEVIGVMRT